MRSLLYRSVSRIEPVGFIVPLLALLGGLFAWFIGNPFVVALLVAIGWALATSALLVAVSFQPGPRLLRYLSSVVILTVTGGLAGLASLSPLLDEPAIVVDEAMLRLTTSRLRVVEREFDRIPALDADAKPATVNGCGVDSGSAHQPSVDRSWDAAVKDATPIANALLGLGWTGSNVADKYGSFRLSKDFGGWSATAFVANAFDDFPATVVSTIDDMSPCSLRD